MKSRAVVLAALLLLVVSCGSDDGSGGAPDACAGTVGCNGECEVGNSYGVGRYCTEGGGECSGWPAAFCTVDFNETDESWCTRPCDPDGDIELQCGEDTSCRDEAGSGPSGCVPIMCL